MNGTSTQPTSRNVTVEDDPEPGDPPPRIPSPPQPQSPPSPPLPQQQLQQPMEDVDTTASDEEPEYTTPVQYSNSLIRQATMPTLPPDLEDFGIPPSPPGSPDPGQSQKLENFRQLRQRGLYFNDRLGGNRGFRNPKLLEKLRGYVGIEDEYGSHLPTNVWNPHGFSEDQYYDKLGTTVTIFTNLVAEKQKNDFEALQARQLTEPRASIEFTSSTSNRPVALVSATERIMEGLNSRPNCRPVSRTGSDSERKRSRYDDKRDERPEDRDYRRSDRRDDRRDGHRSRDKSPHRDRDRYRDRERERERGRNYRGRDYGSQRQ